MTLSQAGAAVIGRVLLLQEGLVQINSKQHTVAKNSGMLSMKQEPVGPAFNCTSSMTVRVAGQSLLSVIQIINLGVNEFQTVLCCLHCRLVADKLASAVKHLLLFFG